MRRLLVLCFVLFACSKHDQKPSKLAPNAELVDGDTLALLTQVTEQGDFVFSGTTPLLTSATAGTVLLFPVSTQTPQGAMRNVDTTSSEGAGMRLSTHAAALNEAFEELHVKASQTVTVAPTNPAALTADGSVDGVSYPFDLTLDGDDGSITVSGALAVAPTIDFNLSLDLVKFELDELSLDVGASETFQASIVGQGAVSEEENDPIATIPFTPIIITVPTPAGAIPVVLTPQVVVELDIKGTASGGFTASVAQDASIDAKVGYIHGALGGTATTDGHATAEPATYQGDASLSIQAGPRFEVLLYGAVGPYAEAQGTLTAIANVGGPPPCVNWSVAAGVTVDAGLELFGDLQQHIYDNATDIASYDSCAAGALPEEQVPRWSESSSRTGSSGESARAVIEPSSGGYLAAVDSSLFGGVSAMGLALWLVRTNADGSVAWQNAYSAGEGVQVRSLVEVAGGFLVATASGAWRFDLAGNVVWARAYASEGNVLDVASLVALADGTAIVAGQGGAPEAPQAWAMRIGADGSVMWSKLYGGDHVNAVRVITGGDVVLVGGDTANARLVRIDTGGNVVWESRLAQQYDDNGSDPGGDILDATSDAFDVIDSGTGLTALGVAYGAFSLPQGNDVGFYAGWRSDVNDSGNANASTIYRGGSDYAYTRFTAGAVNTAGVPLVLGETTRQIGVTDADLLITVGSATSTLRTNGDDYAYDAAHESGGSPLIATADGGYALSVTSNGFGATNALWLLKLGRTGTVTLSGAASLSPSNGVSLQTSLLTAAVDTTQGTAFAVTATDMTTSVQAESTAYTLASQSTQ